MCFQEPPETMWWQPLFWDSLLIYISSTGVGCFIGKNCIKSFIFSIMMISWINEAEVILN